MFTSMNDSSFSNDTSNKRQSETERITKTDKDNTNFIVIDSAKKKDAVSNTRALIRKNSVSESRQETTASLSDKSNEHTSETTVLPGTIGASNIYELKVTTGNNTDIQNADYGESVQLDNSVSTESTDTIPNNSSENSSSELSKEEKRLKELQIILGISENELEQAHLVNLAAVINEDNALAAYTEAKAAVIAAYEDLARYEKAYIEAQENTLEAERILEAKRIVYNNAVEEYESVLQSYGYIVEYYNAAENYSTLMAELEDSLRIKTEALDAFAVASTAYQDALNKKLIADCELEAAALEKENAEDVLKQAEKDRNAAISSLVSLPL